MHNAGKDLKSNFLEQLGKPGLTSTRGGQYWQTRRQQARVLRSGKHKRRRHWERKQPICASANYQISLRDGEDLGEVLEGTNLESQLGAC